MVRFTFQILDEGPVQQYSLRASQKTSKLEGNQMKRPEENCMFS